MYCCEAGELAKNTSSVKHTHLLRLPAELVILPNLLILGFPINLPHYDFKGFNYKTHLLTIFQCAIIRAQVGGDFVITKD